MEVKIMPHQPFPMTHRLTIQIMLALVLGSLTGFFIKYLPISPAIKIFIIDNILQIGGGIFIDLMKMLVIPVVFASLVYGCSSLGSVSALGRIGVKTFALYIITTIIALIFALSIAALSHLGSGIHIAVPADFNPGKAPLIRDVIRNLVPSNPVFAMSSGNMLQVIIFSLFLGSAILLSGKYGKSVRTIFLNFNEVFMRLVTIVMKFAPYGIFCLLAAVFAKQGFEVLKELFQYFMIVLLVLFVQLAITYQFILKILAHLNPRQFFKKMSPAMLFAFSVSSSNASIPVVLETLEDKLGVDNSVASFVVPLGATINMDGTAIMQGVATVFIANAYQINIGLTGYITVVLMATLASIGTAGVPSVGLITLGMVLQQVGLPIEGIALIIGVDRLLDMARTAVNITGDAMVACVVAKNEKLLNQKVYDTP
jgi:Na+/H+-dicarboxylate symporter